MLLSIATLVFGQADGSGFARPKLVVGIIVDQMRWDYLSYYMKSFGSDGFRRLLAEGYSCDNANLDYVPSVTACGHSCIYSGSVPALTGIAGNNFYIGGEKVYCTDDATVSTVGSATDAGKMSPRNLRVTTMADAVKMAQDFESNTVAVSLKDRGAILPAGHTANAAYWYDSDAGHFISSTYYMDALPAWVEAFNEKHTQHDDIRYVPEGNDLVAQMAIAALKGEALGQGATTDFLAVSFSSTDYIGHRYGTRSPQTAEAYRRLDGNLADLLRALDDAVGKGNYLLFLTADHAAAHNAQLMDSHGIPAGRWDEDEALALMNSHLSQVFGSEKPLVKDFIEYRIYLDHDAIASAGLDEDEVETALSRLLMRDSCVAYVVPFSNALTAAMPEPIRERIVRGYDPKRSGDMQVILYPGYYKSSSGSYEDGTDHGTWCPYDTHLPLLFYGWHVPAGHSQQPVSSSDVAATVCAMLGVQRPNGCIGEPIDMQ